MKGKVFFGAVLGAALLVIGAAAVMAAARPEPPLRPVAPALAELAPKELTFASGEIGLAGQLFVPRMAPRSVAIIIHGSGTSSRASPWYAALTALLLEQGHAVLLPDKRGSERSGGDWRTASFQDLAGDTRAAIAKAREELPGVPIGLIGVSQGGWIAPLAAEGEPSLAYVVNLSGAAVTPAEQLTFEEINTIRAAGAPGWLARAIAPATAWRIRKHVQPELWSRIGDFDPTPYWAKLQAPGLILWGAEDEADNLPVAASQKRIAAAANPKVEVRVIEGVGHALMDRKTGRFAPEVVESLQSFLNRAVPPPAQAAAAG